MITNKTILDVLDLEKNKISKCTVDKKLIDADSCFNAILYKEVCVFGENVLKRKFSGSVKNKAIISGSGKKLRIQKRTGKARMRTNRAPQFKGGAVAFGPVNIRNVSLPKINKNKRRKAICMLLSEHFKNQTLYIIDKLKLDTINTKNFINIFYNRFETDRKKILLISNSKDNNLYLSQRNYFPSSMINIHQVSANKLANSAYVFIDQESLMSINDIYYNSK